MANVTNQLTNYYATESEIYELFSSQGFKPEFIANFTRDYSAAKRNINIGAGQIDTNTNSLVEVNAKVEINTGNIQVNANNIITLTLRLDNNDILLAGLRSDLNNHTSANQAHGSTGNIIGTGDFATRLIGGTVLLTEKTDNATLSSAGVSTPDAASAGAAYDQAQINSIVDLANANKSAINQTVSDLNAAINKFNELLTKMRVSKQLELP